MPENMTKKKLCEYLRYQGRQKFDEIKPTWCAMGKWAYPHRVKWMTQERYGERNNHHVLDPSHQMALRSYVAGFLEGNTSANRPWSRWGTDDPDLDQFPVHREWLHTYTMRIHRVLSNSNFYYQAGQFYYDYGVFNTGAHYIDEIKGGLYFHTLVPGSYYVVNNMMSEPVVLVREFMMSVKALVDKYGTKKNGEWDWSNFSSRVRKSYEKGNYTEMVDVVHCVLENEDFDPDQPQGLLNREWISYTYELGGSQTQRTTTNDVGFAGGEHIDPNDADKWLNVSASRRKPFIVGKSQSNDNYEYGETGPTTMAFGMIRSLNKKAASKDLALEQMVKPTLQGPSNLKKSYITNAPNKFIPLDVLSASQKGLQRVFEIDPAIAALIQDVGDMRQMIDKIYYADFLLFLSNNPKTRTATETDAIVKEQQLVIGPNLQSLNTTYNTPVMEFVADYVLFEDGGLPPPPEGLVNKFLRPDYISVFAQAQKAADLPAVDRYAGMIREVSQIDPSIVDKVNLDKLADIYEDRLFLPPGLNNDQSKVDALRQKRVSEQQRQQALTEIIPAIAGAAKDVSQVSGE